MDSGTPNHGAMRHRDHMVSQLQPPFSPTAAVSLVPAAHRLSAVHLGTWVLGFGSGSVSWCVSSLFPMAHVTVPVPSPGMPTTE